MKIFGKSTPKSEMTPGITGGNISSEDCFADDVALWDAVNGLLGDLTGRGLGSYKNLS